MVDVGIKNIPFPLKVASRENEGGILTVGRISVNAHIMQEFEATWIDIFIQNLHQHRQIIGTKTLKNNIGVYCREFGNAPVRIDFQYPLFIEKTTPVTHEKCLVQYSCSYSVKATPGQESKILFKIDVPVITTFPKTSLFTMDRLFGQLSVVTVEVKSEADVYPEDLVDIVDKHALVPVYSYLTPEDQDYVIHKIHKANKTSVVMVEEIKEELAHSKNIEWYSVHCANFGMLHSYSTYIGTEKSNWAPFGEYSAELDRESGL